MLQGNKGLVIQIGKVGFIGTVNIVHPFAVNDRVCLKILLLWIITHGVTHRNLTILGIRSVVDDFSFSAQGFIAVFLSKQEGVIHRRSKLSLHFTAVGAAPTHAVDADRQAVTLVVELMLVIQASIGEKVSVIGIRALFIDGIQRIGQEFFTGCCGKIAVAAPARPTTEPNVEAVGRVNFIIKAKETARVIVLAGVVR